MHVTEKGKSPDTGMLCQRQLGECPARPSPRFLDRAERPCTRADRLRSPAARGVLLGTRIALRRRVFTAAAAAVGAKPAAGS